MKILGALFGFVILAIIVVVNNAAYTVEPRQQVIVLQFGEVKHIVTEPGLHWKTPFIQNLVTLEAKRRLIELDIEPIEIQSSEKERLVVDAFARYRIEDPLVFYTNLRSIEGAAGRLSGWLRAAMTDVAADTKFEDIIKEDRVGTMKRIEAEFIKKVGPKGISIQDVKFKRADLPSENALAIFGLMETEREREAKEKRAQGEELAKKIRTEADYQVTVIKAEAQEKRFGILSLAKVDVNRITSDAEKDAREIRGGAEAKAIKILADAYQLDEEFFELYRSFETYKSFEGQDFVLSTEASFLEPLLQYGDESDSGGSVSVSNVRN